MATNVELAGRQRCFLFFFPFYMEGPLPRPLLERGGSELWGIIPLSMVLRWTRRARPQAALAGGVGQRSIVPGHPGWDSGRCYEHLSLA